MWDFIAKGQAGMPRLIFGQQKVERWFEWHSPVFLFGPFPATLFAAWRKRRSTYADTGNNPVTSRNSAV
jgi:hypothetical protein